MCVLCVDAVLQEAGELVCEFINHPYLSRTEHGLQARFYTMLYNALNPAERYITWQGQKVCVVQKDYPAATGSGRSEQMWDIALIKNPPEMGSQRGVAPYDRLRLAAAVEFGLNATDVQLYRDVCRLADPQAHIDRGFVIHLLRLGDTQAPRPRTLLSSKEVAAMTQDRPVDILYGIHDTTGRQPSCAWFITEGRVASMI